MALLETKTLSSNEQGFTLLETLVALVITSISLVIVLQSISGSFRTRALAQKTYDMAQYAESKLDEIEVITRYPPDDISGRINAQYDWSATFTPFQDTKLDGIEVFWMKVNITDTADRDKTFELERLIMFDLRDKK